jgi:hypothetical protein
LSFWNKNPVYLAALLQFWGYSTRQQGDVVTTTERFPGNLIVHPALALTFNDIVRNNAKFHP